MSKTVDYYPLQRIWLQVSAVSTYKCFQIAHNNQQHIYTKLTQEVQSKKIADATIDFGGEKQQKKLQKLLTCNVLSKSTIPTININTINKNIEREIRIARKTTRNY